MSQHRIIQVRIQLSIQSIDTLARNNKQGPVNRLTGDGPTVAFIVRPRPISTSPRMNK